MKNIFDDVIGIPYPFDYELPSPEDIERARQAEIAKKKSDLEDWLLILEFASEFDNESTDTMVYDPVTDSELPMYMIERRTILNLRWMNREIAKGTADRWANVLEYCDWHLSAEVERLSWRSLCHLEVGMLDEFDTESSLAEQAEYDKSPDVDVQFEIVCAHRAFDYILDAFVYLYETGVMGVSSDVDYTPSPYRPGGKGYRLVK